MTLVATNTLGSRQANALSSVFSGRHITQGAFVDPFWQIVLLPHGLHDIGVVVFSAVAAAIAKAGDSEIVVFDFESTTTEARAAVMQWDEVDLDSLRNTPLVWGDVRVCGPSATWGLIAMQSEDGYMCFGAAHEVMRAFLEEAGGIGALKARFAAFAVGEWFVGKELKSRILGAAGWLPG